MVRRPRLDDLGPDLLTRRVTTMVGAAGYGKTQLLHRWADQVPTVSVELQRADRSLAAALRTVIEALRVRVAGLQELAGLDAGAGPGGTTDRDRVEAFAARMGDALARHRTKPLVLAFDDVDELDGSEGAALIDALVRHAPPLVSFVFAARQEVPVRLARLRAQGVVLDLRAGDLAFTLDETVELASAMEGTGTADPHTVAAEVHQLTSGWPVATRLALEARRRGGGRSSAQRPVRLFEFLAEEVVGAESAEDQALLPGLAVLGEFTAELAQAVGLAADADRLQRLHERGVYFHARSGRYVMSPLVVDFLRMRQHIGDEAERQIRRRAVEVYLERRAFERALRAAREGETDLLAATLRRAGPALVGTAATEVVLEALDHLAASSVGADDAELLRLRGHALLYAGAWYEALESFEAVAQLTDRLDAGLAAPMIFILYQRGKLDEAQALFDRAKPVEGDFADRAVLHGWAASVAWVGGDADQAQKLADEAEELAARSGDDAAIANALTVQAMLAALRGDRQANEAMYLQALRHAERAGDLLAMLRVHVNRGSRHMEEGAFEESIAESEVALDIAQLGGFRSFRAMALCNRGEARTQLGRLDEAASDFAEARTIWEERNSLQVAYALQGMGWVHLARGDLTLAATEFDSAARVAQEAGDVQGLVPALTGQSLVAAATDPAAAVQLAEQAVAAGPNLATVDAMLALANAHLVAGDRAAAAQVADEALAMARARHGRAGMAEALELVTIAEQSGWERLDEAIRMWRDLDAPYGLLRARLRLAGERGARREEIEELLEEAQRLGARPLTAMAVELLDRVAERSRPPVEIRSFGGFVLLRDGAVVGPADWQSKKSRDLLKILVARRGRAVSREQLQEALWPDADPAKTANRLSVALSTLRTVLDPDRVFDADRHLAGDRTSVALQVEHVTVDLEAFHREADEGFAAAQAGERAVASELLRRAESRYGGEAFDEDPYATWAVSAREEARVVYVKIARWLADEAMADDDHDGAARYLLRILERDAFDERAHLTLVEAMIRARRHGEAQRLYSHYCARMEELDVEPAPFPRI